LKCEKRGRGNKFEGCHRVYSGKNKAVGEFVRRVLPCSPPSIRFSHFHLPTYLGTHTSTSSTSHLSSCWLHPPQASSTVPLPLLRSGAFRFFLFLKVSPLLIRGRLTPPFSDQCSCNWFESASSRIEQT